MPSLHIQDLKDLREDLLRAQSAIVQQLLESSPAMQPELRGVIRRLDELVTQIDQMRPLRPDGKHGNLHTPWCGCDITPDRPSQPMRYNPDLRSWEVVVEASGGVSSGVSGAEGGLGEETRAEARVRTLQEQGCTCGYNWNTGDRTTKNPYCPVHKGK